MEFRVSKDDKTFVDVGLAGRKEIAYPPPPHADNYEIAELH